MTSKIERQTFLSPRIMTAAASPMILLVAKTAELRAAGRDVIGLSAGEPDFDTPEHIQAAGITAITGGKTRYTATSGTNELKDAIIAKFKRENGLAYTRNQVVVTTGAKQVLYSAFVATVDVGDEVIIPTPCYPSYEEIVKLCGGTAVCIACPAASGFKLQPAQLREKLTAQTKWLVLNSPSNPTGAVYTREELQEIGEILRDWPNVWVLSDDIYEHCFYANFAYTTIAQVVPSLANRVLTMNGVSKAYCMTGWRLGYAGGPAELITAMSTIQSHTTTHACSISQAAAVMALTGPQDFLAVHNEYYERRRDLVVSRLNDIPGVSCLYPDGAFYVFPSCAELIGKIRPSGERLLNDRDFVTYLMEAEGVVVVPGTDFGLSGHFRISFAESDELLAKACDRIARAVAALRSA